MKQTIRNDIKEIIKHIPQNKKEEYSFHITQKIIEKYGHLKTRHIYQSLPDEIDTTQLISHLKTQNKKIFHPEMEIETVDIIIVPGRAFDKNKNRLGRGKGRYDKFLAKYTNTTIVGICFPQQMVNQIPKENHDIPMDEIITIQK